MMNPFEVKLWVNQFEVRETRIEFVFDNPLAQSNDFKINIRLKVEEICRDCGLALW